MSDVLYEQRGATVLITMNRPQNLNSFNDSLRLGLRAAIDRAAADESVRVVVLTGAGRGFSAGVDLGVGELPTGATVTYQVAEEFGPAIVQLNHMPKLTIAAVNGFMSGIGIGYALACDLVVMGQGAFMQVPFARIALVPDGGICWQFARRLGHQRAMELALEGERVPAQRCAELGLVNRVVPDDQVVTAAMEWAGRLEGAAPVAVRETKRLFREATSTTLAAMVVAEAQAQGPCVDTADFREGVSSFLAKRPPKFTGR